MSKSAFQYASFTYSYAIFFVWKISRAQNWPYRKMIFVFIWKLLHISKAECPSWYCYILILIYRVYIWWLFPSWSSYIPAMQGHSSHSPGCIMTNRLCVFIYSYSYMKTYSLFVMIHPGECEESPCIAGIYELQLGNSHHIWVFIYAYSYINVKLGHSAIST